ncbi:hypothetical protein D3C78_1655260 [compost metagenome]
MAAFNLLLLRRIFLDKGGVENFRTEEQQVNCAEKTHQGKQERRGTDQRSHANIGAENQDRIADKHAQRGGITGTYATCHTGLQYVQRIRARQNDDKYHPGQIGPKIQDAKTL